MFVNVASENGESKLLSSRPYHSVEMNTGGNKLTEINTLINATRRLMIAIEIKYSFLSLVSLMRGFCPRGFCPEGAYVLMELCMEGVLSKGVLSEGVLSKGVLSGGGFVRAPAALPQIRVETLIGSQANYEIKIKITIYFYKIIISCEKYSTLNLN